MNMENLSVSAAKTPPEAHLVELKSRLSFLSYKEKAKQGLAGVSSVFCQSGGENSAHCSITKEI